MADSVNDSRNQNDSIKAFQYEANTSNPYSNMNTGMPRYQRNTEASVEAYEPNYSNSDSRFPHNANATTSNMSNLRYQNTKSPSLLQFQFL